MNPTPEEIKAARERAGLTQREAGRLIGYTLRAWQQWEGGQREMRYALLDLFNIRARARTVGVKNEK